MRSARRRAPSLLGVGRESGVREDATGASGSVNCTAPPARRLLEARAPTRPPRPPSARDGAHRELRRTETRRRRRFGRRRRARRRDFDLGGGAFSPARSASVPIPGAATRRDATPSVSSSSAPPPSRAPEARAMWELDSVAPLPASAPPPKAEGEKPKRSYLSRAYKGLRRAAGFKSKKTARALLPAVSETAERPRRRGERRRRRRRLRRGVPRQRQPVRLLRTLETSPKTAGTSPGIRERGASGPADADARRAKPTRRALAAAAARTQPGTKKKSFSLYSAYKGFRRRVRGDFSDLGSSVKRPASLRPARGAAARGRGEGEGDGDDEEEGLPPRPRAGSPDDRESAAAAALAQGRGRAGGGEKRTRTRRPARDAHAGRPRAPREGPRRVRRRAAAAAAVRSGAPPSRARRRRRKAEKTEKPTRTRRRAPVVLLRRARGPPPGRRVLRRGVPSRARVSPEGDRSVGGGRRSAFGAGPIKVAVGDLVGDMRRRHEATVLVAGGMLRAFDELEKLEPAAGAFGRVQRRTDDGEVWARGRGERGGGIPRRKTRGRII